MTSNKTEPKKGHHLLLNFFLSYTEWKLLMEGWNFLTLEKKWFLELTHSEQNKPQHRQVCEKQTLCQKMVSLLVFHIVWGYLCLWKMCWWNWRGYHWDRSKVNSIKIFPQTLPLAQLVLNIAFVKPYINIFIFILQPILHTTMESTPSSCSQSLSPADHQPTHCTFKKKRENTAILNVLYSATVFSTSATEKKPLHEQLFEKNCVSSVYSTLQCLFILLQIMHTKKGLQLEPKKSNAPHTRRI